MVFHKKKPFPYHFQRRIQELGLQRTRFTVTVILDKNISLSLYLTPPQKGGLWLHVSEAPRGFPVTAHSWQCFGLLRPRCVEPQCIPIAWHVSSLLTFDGVCDGSLSDERFMFDSVYSLDVRHTECWPGQSCSVPCLCDVDLHLLHLYKLSVQDPHGTDKKWWPDVP